jgi:hypothetical protein
MEMAVLEESIISKIYLVRGQKVMLDSDLAELYGLETKLFKRAGQPKYRPLSETLYVSINQR